MVIDFGAALFSVFVFSLLLLFTVWRLLLVAFVVWLLLRFGVFVRMVFVYAVGF